MHVSVASTGPRGLDRGLAYIRPLSVIGGILKQVMTPEEWEDATQSVGGGIVGVRGWSQ